MSPRDALIQWSPIGVIEILAATPWGLIGVQDICLIRARRGIKTSGPRGMVCPGNRCHVNKSCVDQGFGDPRLGL